MGREGRERDRTVREEGPRVESGTLLDLQSQSTPDDRDHVETPGDS